MMFRSLKEEKRQLSHKPTSWSNYLWRKMRTDTYGVKGGKIARSEFYLGKAFAEHQRDSDFTSTQESHDAMDFASELFGRIYEESPEIDEENQIGWAKKAHSIIDTLPEMDGLIAAVDGDSDVAALCTEELINQASEEIAKYRAIQEPDQEDDGRFRRSMKKVLNRVKQKGQDYSEIKRQTEEFCKDENGNDQDLNDRKNFVKMLDNSSQLKELIQQIGRMFDMISAIPAKTKESDQFEFTGLTYGDDISRLTSVDTMDLASPETEDLFYYKYITSNLSIEERNGMKDSARGSFVLLLDTSGSMQGDNIFWATCLAASVLKSCIKEKRACTIVPFNGGVKYSLVLNQNGSCEYIDHGLINKGNRRNISRTELFGRVISGRSGGGTSFEYPFKEALQHLKSDSDILFLTDGHASELSSDTHNELKKHKEDGLRVWTILFDEETTTKAITSLSEQIVKISPSSREWTPSGYKDRNSDEICLKISQTIKNGLES